MVRAKMNLSMIVTQEWGAGSSSKKLVFNTTYDPTLPEDQRFSKASPSGTIEMQIDNPAALAQFEAGKQYYVDFSPVPVRAAAPDPTPPG